MLAFVHREASFIREIAGGAVARLVLLTELDAQLRDDRSLIAATDAATPPERMRLLREALRGCAARRRRELLLLTRLEALHRRLYDHGVDRSGRGRSDAERDAARAKYAGVYRRMVEAVGYAVVDGALQFGALSDAITRQRWPAGLPHRPWREGSHDLVDEVRGGHAHASIDGHLRALDRDDGRPDMRIVAALATTRDVATQLVAREELGGRVAVVLAEYSAFKRDVSTARRLRTRRALTLLLAGRTSSAAICEQLRADGFGEMRENSIDVAWNRAIRPYPELQDVLSRRRPDLDDVVWTLERLTHRPSRTTGRPSTTVR